MAGVCMMLGPDYWKLGALNIKVEPEDLIVNKPDCLKRPGLFFFSLRYGRSRSKARSLHEKKLLLRKLLHGHRWSHAAWQIIQNKTQTTKNARQDADPPARFASYHQKDSEANSERGKSPTETITKDLPRHSGKNPLCRNKLKNLQQTN